MTWHFILPNLLNIACGSLTEVKSCQRKELLYARFLCKNRFPNTVLYFASHSYIKKKLSSAVHSSKAKGNEVKTSGLEGVNLGPAFSSFMCWHWPGRLPPCNCQHKETLAQFTGKRDLWDWNKGGLKEYRLWSPDLFLNFVIDVMKKILGCKQTDFLFY